MEYPASYVNFLCIHTTLRLMCMPRKYKRQVKYSVLHHERVLHNYFKPSLRKYRGQRIQSDIGAACDFKVHCNTNEYTTTFPVNKVFVVLNIFLSRLVAGWRIHRAAQRNVTTSAGDEESLGAHPGMYKLDEESWEGGRRLASITSGLTQQQAGGSLNVLLF